jgi:hypothetical protein
MGAGFLWLVLWCQSSARKEHRRAVLKNLMLKETDWSLFERRVADGDGSGGDG